ncbi:MAG: TonB-dependent receptor [Bacteroidota bacterium]
MNIYNFLKVIIVVLLLPSISRAANLLKGKITDEHGKVLEGVIVEIADLKSGAASDSNGYYIIRNLPRGRFVAEVHLLGYTTITRTINIDGETTQDFQLGESVVEKTTVVVTGTSLATEERQNITPIQSISIKEMRENAATNVIDAITKLPGVTALSTGPAISKPVIRGLGSNRIITLNEGVRQEGQQWGDEHGIEIDDYNVTRIEVLKGPASLAYGSDALAGVVNIISSPNIPSGKIAGGLTVNYQTNPGLAAAHANIGGNKNGLTWHAYGTQKAAHDYRNKYDGYVFNTRFRNTDYGAALGINKSWGSSQLYYTSFHMKTGLAEGERDSATGKLVKESVINGAVEDVITTDADGRSYEMHTPYQRIDHEKLVWDNNIYLRNGGRLGLVLGYQANNRREYTDVTSSDVAGLHLLLQTATYNIRYILPAKNGWQTSAGINGMLQWNTTFGDEFLVPGYSLADGGIYAMAKKEWHKWNIAGGLRYDLRRLNAYGELRGVMVGGYPVFEIVSAPFVADYSNLAGSIGAGRNISERAIVKFNFASGYRAPNIAELGANGVHEGTVRYEIGNNRLTSEKSFQADLGLSWNSEHLMVNVSLFDNYIRNFIYIRKLAGANSVDSIPQTNNDEGFSAFVFTQGDANLYGGEIYSDFHPHPLDWLHLENTFSYVRGKLMNAVEGTNNLPYMPPARWLVELRAQKRSLGSLLKNAYAKAGLDINFAQDNVFTAYGTERPAEGYTLFNAGIGADVANAKKHTLFTITIAAQNIMDVAYQNTLSRLRYTPANNATGRVGLYNMGRNISVLVSVPLDVR